MPFVRIYYYVSQQICMHTYVTYSTLVNICMLCTDIPNKENATQPTRMDAIAIYKKSTQRK